MQIFQNYRASSIGCSPTIHPRGVEAISKVTMNFSSCLTTQGNVIAYRNMKQIFVALLGMSLLAVGCVKTVNDTHTAAVPFVKDKFEGRYERSVDQVYNASVEVVKSMGTVSRESVLTP